MPRSNRKRTPYQGREGMAQIGRPSVKAANATVEALEAAKKAEPRFSNLCQACSVRGLSVCSALNPEDLHRLDDIVSHVQVTAGQMVLLEGDPADHLFVITDGCVKLYKMLADGRRQITGFLFPSDFLGLAMRDRYAYSAEAVAGSMLCRFPKRKLENLLEEFPSLEKRLLGIASNELASAQDQMLLLGRKTAQEKLASFLHSLHRRALKRGDKGEEIDLSMSRADIADYLGLTVETVSRCFTRLRKLGFIDFVTPQTIRVLRIDSLAELSGIAEED